MGDWAVESYWLWVGVGVLLVAAEAFVPGALFIWFGLAAIVTGVVDALFAPAWEYQLILFSLLGVLSSVGFWTFRKRQRQSQIEESSVNRYGSDQIGQILTLIAPIENGHGRAKYSDTSVRVDGPDAPAGRRVRVTGVDAGTLQVELLDEE